MHFQDSETQRLLRTTAKSFLANAYPVDRLYRIESGAEQITDADIDEQAGLGWFDLLVPEANVGATEAQPSAAALLDAAAVVEELGYAGVPSPVPAANIAAYTLAVAGRPDLAPGCIVSESARLQASSSTVTVAGAVASGALPLVPFADLRERVLAPVTIGSDTALVVISLRDARAEPVALMDRRCYSNVRFDNAPVEVIATGDRARELSEQLDALSTAFATIELAGTVQRILELTTEHVTTRQQFGQPIGRFQSARHRAADILVQLDTTRWAAYHALWLFEKDPARTDEIYLAKHWAIRAADRVFQNAHMLHGGVGVGMDHPLHLFTQSMSSLAVRGGTMSEVVDRTLAHLKSA